MQQIIDISEDFIGSLSPQCLKALLEDHTKSTAKKYVPIFWATDNYKHLGLDYGYSQPIFPELITGKHNKVVQPRVVKNKDVQAARSKDMAEVFTPAWICNLQNNLLDAQWFGRKGVFNEEIEIDGKCSWKNSEGKIEFPEGKTWQDYVLDTRMEISCGEAPYTVSRYDATTGEFIPLENRIGFLDRKLRVVGEIRSEKRNGSSGRKTLTNRLTVMNGRATICFSSGKPCLFRSWNILKTNSPAKKSPPTSLKILQTSSAGIFGRWTGSKPSCREAARNAGNPLWIYSATKKKSEFLAKAAPKTISISTTAFTAKSWTGSKRTRAQKNKARSLNSWIH